MLATVVTMLYLRFPELTHNYKLASFDQHRSNFSTSSPWLPPFHFVSVSSAFISKHHAAHLEYIQFAFVSYTSKLKTDPKKPSMVPHQRRHLLGFVPSHSLHFVSSEILSSPRIHTDKTYMHLIICI